MTQLELCLEEYGENAAHIEQLEREAKKAVEPPRVFVPYQKPKPIDPWPAHMRFDQ